MNTKITKLATIGAIILAMFSSCKKDEVKPFVLTDFDGNEYKTVTIGSQEWMAENLRTTKYADGAEIQFISNGEDWAAATEGSYCWFNDDETNAGTYGALYNWYTIATDKLCPTGWHVPTDEEWEILENYLAENGYNYDGSVGGGREKIAKALASDTGWDGSDNEGSIGNTDYPEYRNKSGFTALPGGTREGGMGMFSVAGGFGYFWTSTEVDPGFLAYGRILCNYNAHIDVYPVYEKYGYSVRCIKD